MRGKDSKALETPAKRAGEKRCLERKAGEVNREAILQGLLILALDESEKVWYKRGMEERRMLYLKVGDWVVHRKYPEWGSGRVVEEQNSSVVGGLSLVKVTFLDGQTRVFDNNFKNATCCYHAGLRRR